MLFHQLPRSPLLSSFKMIVYSFDYVLSALCPVFVLSFSFHFFCSLDFVFEILSCQFWFLCEFFFFFFLIRWGMMAMALCLRTHPSCMEGQYFEPTIFYLILHQWFDPCPYSCHLHRLPPPSTLEMVVPGHAVGKVMGKGGANIGNIRKVGPLFFVSYFCFDE